MVEASANTAITFRCPPELEPILPRPLLAVLGLPDWFKAMPQKAFSPLLQNDQMTVKKCPPFIDAMTYGFLMPLVADLKVENGEFSWDREVPRGALNCYPRSPIDFHDNLQVAGTPLLRRRSLHHQVQQFLDHRAAAGLFAAWSPIRSTGTICRSRR